jgi:hypothetical protein
VLRPTLPELYFITESWKEIGDTFGGDWDALHRFTLDTRQCELVARPSDLAMKAPYRTCWLVALLSVAPDGETIFCRAGFETERGTVEHYLAELSVPHRRVIGISKLGRVFA